MAGNKKKGREAKQAERSEWSAAPSTLARKTDRGAKQAERSEGSAAPSTRKARQDGVETREAILAAAEAEFADKGFELASAREICRRAEVNSALLSRYFGSKEALYRIVAKRLFGEKSLRPRRAP